MDNGYNIKSNEPRLIYNNLKRSIKVKQEIEKCFDKCESFDLSVAFVKDSGISAIKQSLLNVARKGIKGRIVTSTYLGFNSPKSFRLLYDLFKKSNVEVRIFKSEGFHPKGYIFQNDDSYQIIVGSSNLTQSALCVNQEWNICLSGNNKDEVIKRINSEFEDQWKNSIPLTEKFINDYAKDYKEPIYYVGKQGKKEFEPNVMQTEALMNLKDMRKAGKDRALLISATGTGKTFLSAFDVRNVNPLRMLFVVHRETIAKKSLETYKQVVRSKSLGMFTGNQKEKECDYLFATINIISKDEYLKMFKPDEFDYIVIDEVHRAGAEMYKKMLSYFKPKFLLGMSATPERTDKPEKIYELFNYNVAYEIRLKQAMEYNLLCPFHYFGVSDLMVNGKPIDDKTSFNRLITKERFNHIVETIKTYDYSGDKPHGLIFVSRAEEAYALSELFNKNTNYKTIALTGKDSENVRSNAIDMLEEIDTSKPYLDYIFTVDIFNEGIDIPCINQVVMLRPTESAIVFVQQLGRGLRKNPRKDYVTVIDIIGNYDNNFMIPIALSGSLKLNREELRRFVYEGDSSLPGCSTIAFDEITKSRIYESVDQAKLGSMKLLKEEYHKLKARIGNRIPTLSDFDRYSSVDPIVIFNAAGSYYNFLLKVEPDFKIRLDDDNEAKYLKFVSTKFASGKRIHELELINQLINDGKNVFKNLKRNLKTKYHIEYNDLSTKTLINEMTGRYIVGSNLYKNVILIEKDGKDYSISNQFIKLLANMDFVTLLKETVDFGINRYLKNYSNRYENTDFVLYQKYTYDDVFRLLNWEKSEVSLNVGGYKYDKNTNTFPVFINYDKAEANASIQYKDELIDKKHMIAISKHPRTIKSSDAQIIENAKNSKTKIHIFMRKNKKEETKEFYYLGLVEKEGKLIDSKMKSGDKIFTIPYTFKTEIRQDLFDYICD